MSLCGNLLDNMGNFNSYVCDKYILDDNKFVRNRKLTQECIMKGFVFYGGVLGCNGYGCF